MTDDAIAETGDWLIFPVSDRVVTLTVIRKLQEPPPFTKLIQAPLE